jgi:hypothetical protein
MVQLVHAQKQHDCSICRKPIAVGEVCLMFTNKKHNRFRIHFRHLKCQFERVARAETIERYIRNVSYHEEKLRAKKFVDEVVAREKSLAESVSSAVRGYKE